MSKFQTPPIQGQPFLDNQEPSYPWQRWFQLIQNALSGSAVPPTAASAGTPIQVQGLATDGTFLYVCTGTNTWKRIALSAF